MSSYPSFLTSMPDITVTEVTYRPNACAGSPVPEPRVLAVLGFGSTLSLTVEDARTLLAGLVVAVAEHDRRAAVKAVA